MKTTKYKGGMMLRYVRKTPCKTPIREIDTCVETVFVWCPIAKVKI